MLIRRRKGSRASVSPQNIIAPYNDLENNSLATRYSMLTMQQAHDLSRAIFEDEDLAGSLGIDDFKAKLRAEAKAIRKIYDVQNSSEDETLPGRSLIISPFVNRKGSIDEDANKSIVYEILKFLGSPGQKNISFALCSAPRFIRHGTHAEISGSTHWTALNIKKVIGSDGKTEIRPFYADSMGSSVPEIIKEIFQYIANLPTAIDENANLPEKMAELGLMDISGDRLNDTQKKAIKGLEEMQKDQSLQLYQASPVGCATQSSNAAGYGNTCCENALFNMFSMHYDDGLIESRSIGSEEEGDKKNSWNTFITMGRPKLNEAIKRRINPQSTDAGGSSTTPKKPKSPLENLNDRLSRLEIETPSSTDDITSKLKEHHLLNIDIIKGITSNPELASDFFSLRERAMYSFSIIFQSLIDDLDPIPTELIDSFHQYRDNTTNLEDLNKTFATIIDNLSVKTEKAAHAIVPASSPINEAERALLETLKSVREAITSKTIATALNKEVNKNPPTSEEFLKPRSYSGLGIKTDAYYNGKDGRFEFRITKVFKDGLAAKLGIVANNVITFPSATGSLEEMKEAAIAIRNSAHSGRSDDPEQKISLLSDTPPPEKNLYDEIAQKKRGLKPGILIHEEQAYAKDQFLEKLRGLASSQSQPNPSTKPEGVTATTSPHHQAGNSKSRGESA